MLNCRNQNSWTRSSYSGQCKKTYLSRAYSGLICFVTCLWHLTSAHVVEHGYNPRKEAWDTASALLGDCFCEREERISAQNWGQLNFDGIVLPVDRKKRGLVLTICLQIADVTFRFINFHIYLIRCTKRPGGSVSIYDLLFNKKGHTRSFFWLSPNFSTERKLAVSQP